MAEVWGGFWGEAALVSAQKTYLGVKEEDRTGPEHRPEV